jgi:hypothetical protein
MTSRCGAAVNEQRNHAASVFGSLIVSVHAQARDRIYKDPLQRYWYGPRRQLPPTQEVSGVRVPGAAGSTLAKCRRSPQCC